METSPITDYGEWGISGIAFNMFLPFSSIDLGAAMLALSYS